MKHLEIAIEHLQNGAVIVGTGEDQRRDSMVYGCAGDRSGFEKYKDAERHALKFVRTVMRKNYAAAQAKALEAKAKKS